MVRVFMRCPCMHALTPAAGIQSRQAGLRLQAWEHRQGLGRFLSFAPLLLDSADSCIILITTMIWFLNNGDHWSQHCPWLPNAPMPYEKLANP